MCFWEACKPFASNKNQKNKTKPLQTGDIYISQHLEDKLFFFLIIYHLLPLCHWLLCWFAKHTNWIYIRTKRFEKPIQISQQVKQLHDFNLAAYQSQRTNHSHWRLCRSPRAWGWTCEDWGGCRTWGWGALSLTCWRWSLTCWRWWWAAPCAWWRASAPPWTARRREGWRPSAARQPHLMGEDHK